MPLNDNADELRLGFLTAVEVAGRGYVGGLLVTNRFGRPLEFQCTSPVQPNRMQEILYGPTLLPYVLTELIGTTLLDKVGIKPHIVLTEQEALLELRSHISIPVALVKSEAEPVSEPAVQEVQSVAERPTVLNSVAPTSAESTAVDDAPAAVLGSAETTSAEEAPIGDPASVSEPVEPTAEETASVVNPPAPAATEAERRGGVSSVLPRELRLGRQFLRFHDSHTTDREAVAAGATSVPAEADLCEPFTRVREALEETTRAGSAR